MDPYVGEIRLFAGKFAPAEWAFCEGQTLNVQEYQALFAVIANQFGGDGDTTFCLPDLRGLVPIHQGAGSGLTPRLFNQTGGTRTVTITETQMPFHDHSANCQTASDSTSPVGAIWSNTGRTTGNLVYSQKADTPMNAKAVGTVGGGQPHNNMQPYVAMNYIIALRGVFPPKG